MIIHLLISGMQNDMATLEDNVVDCTKLNTLSPYNPVTGLLSIYPEELKTYVHTKGCTQMSLAALFIISKNLETTKMTFNR